MAPDGHDHGVLDELGAHEAQDLGAEVLRPVRPADAAARDRREAQVDGLHARRVDPDLAERARLRRCFHGLAVELEGQRGRAPAGRVRLVEVGAHRDIDQVVELAQDAVLIQARHGGKRAFDALPDRRLGRLPLGRLEAAVRIEAQVEELDQVAGEAGMTREGVGEVAQAERRAELAKTGGIGPQHRHFAPLGARGYDKAIEAVVVGLPAEHGEEAAFEPLVVTFELDGSAVAGLQDHVVQGHVALAVGKARTYVIGALVDGREAQVLQHGHPLGQGDRRTQRIDRGVDAARGHAGHAIEIDDDGMLRAQALDALDVLQRALGREGVRVAGGKGRPVLGLQGLRPLALRGDGVGQPVLPGAHDLDNPALQLAHVDSRRRAVIAADNELHANQRAFREVGIERGHPALVGLGKEHPDALAHARIVPVARGIDQHRHETVEAVDAREDAHARPRLEIEDALAPGLQLLGADLKQLVAREGVENVEQRLAGVAGGRVAGGREHGLDLVTQQGDLAGRADVGLRGEQPHEADLSLGPAVTVVGLDADVVHVRAPMHAAHDIGFGDDEGRRREEEAPHLGRHRHQLAAAAQHLHLRIAQDAEAAALHGHEVARVGIVRVGIARELEDARAEEREVGLLEPLQKCRRLAQHTRREVRLRSLQLIAPGLEALQHRAPVGDHDTHLGKDVGELRSQIARFGLRQGAQVDGDVAFLMPVAPVSVAGTADGQQVSGLVALGLEDRMEQEAHREAAGLQLAQHRIDEERHVVVEDLDDRALGERPLAACGHAADPDLVPTLGLAGDELHRLAGVAGEPVGRQAFEPSQPVASVEQRREDGGLRSLSQCLLHLADEAAWRGFDVESHWRCLPWRAKRNVVNPSGRH